MDEAHTTCSLVGRERQRNKVLLEVGETEYDLVHLLLHVAEFCPSRARGSQQYCKCTHACLAKERRICFSVYTRIYSVTRRYLAFL